MSLLSLKVCCSTLFPCHPCQEEKSRNSATPTSPKTAPESPKEKKLPSSCCLFDVLYRGFLHLFSSGPSTIFERFIWHFKMSLFTRWHPPLNPSPRIHEVSCILGFAWPLGGLVSTGIFGTVFNTKSNPWKVHSLQKQELEMMYTPEN